MQDTILVDTLTTAVETLPPVLDSLTNAVAGQITGELNGIVALGLGIVVTFVMTFARKLMVKLDSAPALLKSVVVLAFGQLAVYGSGKLGFFINPDFAAFDMTVAGGVVALVAMGVHALMKVVGLNKEGEPAA